MNYKEITIKVTTNEEKKSAMLLLSHLTSAIVEVTTMSAVSRRILDGDKRLYGNDYVGYIKENKIDGLPCSDRICIDFNQIYRLFEPASETVPLNMKYSAVVTKYGITVGCQTFPLSVADALVAAVKNVK